MWLSNLLSQPANLSSVMKANQPTINGLLKKCVVFTTWLINPVEIMLARDTDLYDNVKLLSWRILQWRAIMVVQYVFPPDVRAVCNLVNPIAIYWLNWPFIWLTLLPLHLSVIVDRSSDRHSMWYHCSFSDCCIDKSLLKYSFYYQSAICIWLFR